MESSSKTTHSLNDCRKHEFINVDIEISDIVEAIAHQKSTVKSFDDDQLHPKIIKKLPLIAIAVLERIFNLCLNLGEWVWNTSNVVFTKKVGKANYMKAGSYRPISISSYIGKLFERILEKRIRHVCDLDGVLDDEQEGFRATRNTTRYLYKLIASLKEAQKKKLTTFLLCIDFEKAFDSVWLKGLIVKLHDLNINGRILNLINSFLFNRKVQIIINKHKCASRKCGKFGVPQGSVLSPLLFIIFISDMLKDPSTSNLIDLHANVFKYADDGSVAITHEDPKTCNLLAQEVCNVLSFWCKRWKLIVNCGKDKTECLIIKPNKFKLCTYSNLADLKIGQKQILYTDSTMVLGLQIDDNLKFTQHANMKIKQCWYSWYNITRNSNRNHGLNLSSQVILFKTIVCPKLMYASPVWLQEKNQQKFKSFFARVCLKISGATHYTPQALTMIASGIEPLIVQYNIICTKFLLKSLSSDDNMKGLIFQLEESRDHTFYHHIQLVKAYLTNVKSTIKFRNGRTNLSLAEVESNMFIYKTEDMKAWKEKLWEDYLVTRGDKKSRSLLCSMDNINNDGYSKLTTNTLATKMMFPRNAKRSTDTKVMALLHGHDLNFKSFKYKTGLLSSPFCHVCPGKIDNNIHQLMECSKYQCEYRRKLKELIDASANLPQAMLIHANLEHVNSFRNMAQLVIVK